MALERCFLPENVQLAVGLVLPAANGAHVARRMPHVGRQSLAAEVLGLHGDADVLYFFWLIRIASPPA